VRDGLLRSPPLRWALCGTSTVEQGMTEYELNTLLLATTEGYGGVLEFWVSISFAVVVASFFTSKQLNRNVIGLMTFLYMLSSLFLASLYIATALKSSHYYQIMSSAGFDVSHFDHPVNFITLSLIFLLFIGGTFGTVFYMRTCVRDSGVQSDAT
jgi:hypothetical protein